jgi:predicted nucleic acid-binding protein
MSARYVIDTNLLVYLHDVKDPAKRARAGAVIQRLAVAQSAAVPAQVLAEFASVAMKKMKPPLDPEGVRVQPRDADRLLPRATLDTGGDTGGGSRRPGTQSFIL